MQSADSWSHWPYEMGKFLGFSLCHGSDKQDVRVYLPQVLAYHKYLLISSQHRQVVGVLKLRVTIPYHTRRDVLGSDHCLLVDTTKNMWPSKWLIMSCCVSIDVVSRLCLISYILVTAYICMWMSDLIFTFNFQFQYFRGMLRWPLGLF